MISDLINLTKNCKKCYGLGYLEDASLCSCRLKLYRYISYYEANIPRIYWDCFYSSFMTSKANNDLLKSILTEPEKNIDFLNLGFFGPTLSGKSTTAAMIAKAVIDKDLLSVYWFNFTDLLYQLRRRFTDNTVEAQIDAALKSKLLILDDLGRDFALDKAFAKTEITRIFQSFFESARFIILTTNLFITDLERNFDVKFNSLVSLNLTTITFQSGTI